MNSITCIAPTKCFNIAGLQTSAVSIPNPVLRHKVNRALNTDEVAEPNTFAVTAAIAAFKNGGKWLDEMRAYVFENKCLVDSFIKNELPQVKLVKSEATYLLWLDVSALNKPSGEIASFIRKETGLFLSSGSAYGEGGNGFLRMNIACPRANVEDGLKRLKAGVEMLEKV